MDKYSPFYHDLRYQHDIKKLSTRTLEERIIFLNIMIADPKTNVENSFFLEKYKTKYQKEWDRRRSETNNNNN